jgi:BirA family biotin operon repressor/biotin-[acetyl-CoA-carboxylase] ligase
MNVFLEALRSHADYVAEADLIRATGLSAGEVRRSLIALRRLGYEIEDHPDLGYRLLAAPDALLEEEILHGLRARVIGRRLHCYEVVGSTNDVAFDLAARGAPEGTVALAEEQTAGRGRQGRAWHSPPRVGITMSCILRPPLQPSELWVVTACASVAVCRAVAGQTGLRPAVKKPNDVLVEGRKVCGILTEARRETVVLGIGISVNHEWKDFPEELHEVAASLRIASGQKVDRIGLLRRTLEALDAGYQELKKDGGRAAVERWERLSQ